jgi:DNA-binding protein
VNVAQKKKAQKAKPVKKKPSKKVPKKKVPKEAKKETPKEMPKKVPRETRAENVVFIGRKPVMNYVVACITSFNSGGNEVTVKARGRAISRAVDTIELLRRAFVKDLEVKSINIDTEEIQREEGGTRNVSTLEITVAKTGSK